LSAREFYSITPKFFAELLWQERRKARELASLVALLRMDVINFSMRHPKIPVSYEDLMPFAEAGPTAPPVKPLRMTAKRRQVTAGRLRATFAPLLR
jgi:hypothetical protein